MTAKIIGIQYKPCENDSFIEQGFKRGQTPDCGKWYGGNGTYRIIGSTPADITVVVVTQDGEQLKLNIGDKVRRIKRYCRLTSQRADRICDGHPQQIELVKSGNHWNISETSLVEWLKNVQQAIVWEKVI